MIPPLVSYQHPSTGLTLPLPEEWERVEDTEGIALIAVEPERGPWFRANAVVTIEQLDPQFDLGRWHEHSLALLPKTLRDFHLIDVEETEVAGLPARRTLVHHRTESEHIINAVTLEQWTLVQGVLGYTLSTSAATLEYDELADVFAEMARRFQPARELPR